jgi:hypothetical protein
MLGATILALSAAAQAAGTAPAPEPVSSYRISLRANGQRLEISGVGTFPALERPASEFEVYLSALIDTPRFVLRCAGRAVALEGLASRLDGGDRKWTLHALRPCPAGAVPQLEFGYTLQGIAAPQMRVTDSFSFAGGGGELWYPQRSFAERQVGRIDIDVPARFGAIATGSLRRQSRAGGRRRLRFVSTAPAKLAFAYGPYVEGEAGGTRLLSTLSPAQAQALVRSLRPIIDSLGQTFGMPPFAALSLVEVPFDGRVLGTSEYGMIFAQPERMRGDFDAPYWGHEFGHQWWGNSVRAASGTPGASLLTEGLAQYGAGIAIEATQGPAPGRSFRLGTLGGNPYQSIETYRAVIRSGRDRAPVFLPQGQEEILLAHQLATSKGALVLRYFASLVGEARFHAALRSFIAAKAGGRTSWGELEAWIDAQTGGGHSWFFEQWLHRPGAPELAISYCVAGRTLRAEVSQSGTPFRLQLPLEIEQAGAKRRVSAEVAGPVTRLSFDGAGTDAMLSVDPDALVPTAAPTRVVRMRTCPGGAAG